MWTMLAGVPGKLKTLVDRLTATRAANLDNLNATISSRAAASTALSNAVWTDARAGNLDLIGAVNGAQLFTSSGTWTRPAGVNRVRVIVVGGGQGGRAGSTSSIGTAGNGGRGGAVVISDVAVTGNVSVTVGQGGAGGATGGTSPPNAGEGQSSSFGSIVAPGGTTAAPLEVNFAQFYSSRAGGAGGSNNTPAAGASGQYLPFFTSAGGAGGSPSGSGGGGGGGGGAYGPGGNGASVSGAGQAAAANTGGGGGGGMGGTSATAGGSGGSGIVIVMW